MGKERRIIVRKREVVNRKMGKGTRHRERWKENIMGLGAQDENSLPGQETGSNIRRWKKERN